MAKKKEEMQQTQETVQGQEPAAETAAPAPA